MDTSYTVGAFLFTGTTPTSLEKEADCFNPGKDRTMNWACRWVAGYVHTFPCAYHFAFGMRRHLSTFSNSVRNVIIVPSTSATLNFFFPPSLPLWYHTNQKLSTGI